MSGNQSEETPIITPENDSKPKRDYIFYSVSATWVISLILWVLGEIEHFQFNPIPAVAAAIVGAAIHGYVGAGDRYLEIMVFIYATLFGVVLGLWLKHFDSHRTMIVVIAIGVHLLVSFFALFPLMLIGGR